jgi:hypothetical protein
MILFIIARVPADYSWVLRDAHAPIASPRAPNPRFFLKKLSINKLGARHGCGSKGCLGTLVCCGRISDGVMYLANGTHRRQAADQHR